MRETAAMKTFAFETTIDAVIDDVNYNSASDLVLLEVNGERVKRRRG